MNSLAASFDWSHVRAFLAVAEHGSLSAAARALGTSQPTVGRQVHAMEAAAGTAMFERRARGMVLTAAGADLLEPARDMAKAAGQLALRAAGAGSAIGGTVRITASVFSSHHILPPILARVRAAEPEIAIELVASDTTENLLYREADIAVRMYRPRQLDIVTRHIGDLPLGIFGARHYLDRAGRPGSPDDLLSHQFVGYDRNEAFPSDPARRRHRPRSHGRGPQGSSTGSATSAASPSTSARIWWAARPMTRMARR
jgi:DNA-binding transcriptional LysR family regulator